MNTDIISNKKGYFECNLDHLVCRKCLCMTKIFIHFNVYHDQNSMSERTGGLKCLLVVVILIFPLHALFYDRAGLWVIIFPVQEEQSWCHILYSCWCVRNIYWLHLYQQYKQYNLYTLEKKNNGQSQIPKVCEVALSSWISKCLAPLGISRTLRKPERKHTSGLRLQHHQKLILQFPD